MKNNVPLSSLGLIVCLCVPIALWSGLLDYSPRSGFETFLRVVILAPLGLSLMMGAVWVVWGSSYNWKSADEKERAAFLQREQRSPDDEWKLRLLLVAFMLVVSGVTATLAYGLFWLWKPPTISLPLFMAATAILSVYATIAVLVWLELCDRKLRASRPPQLELISETNSSLGEQM